MFNFDQHSNEKPHVEIWDSPDSPYDAKPPIRYGKRALTAKYVHLINYERGFSIPFMSYPAQICDLPPVILYLWELMHPKRSFVAGYADARLNGTRHADVSAL